MPAGIQITNDHGTILIDETYRNLAVTDASTGGVVAIGQSKNFRFDVPVPTSQSFGLQIFDAAGQCTFDSNLKYARVVDALAGPSPGNTIVRNYESGREYAVIVNKRAVEVVNEVRPDPDSPPGWWNYRRVFHRCLPSISGHVVTFAWGIFSTGNWSLPLQVIPDPPTPDLQSRFIVLDVTGY